MKWCQLFLFFLLVAAFIPSRNKYLSWDSSLICLYPKLIESNDVNWLENAAWDENKLKGNWCRPSRTCARRDRQGWESKTQVITDFVTTIGCWKWRMGLEKPRSHFSIPPICKLALSIFCKKSNKHFSAMVKKTEFARKLSKMGLSGAYDTSSSPQTQTWTLRNWKELYDTNRIG